jgi:hypothetical protein
VDFRHTLTTNMRKRNIDPRVISDVLGHDGVNLAMETYDGSDANDIATALRVTTGNNSSSASTTPMFILKELVSAEGIEPSTY